ncbi:MAG: aminotransferase class IV [Weeksellaceae bacterium]
MFRLIESICVIDGKVRNLNYHQKRMDHSVFGCFEIKNKLKLADLISEIRFPAEGKFKLRILYSEKIESIRLISYLPRIIRSFQLISDDQISYNYKNEDRSDFEYLMYATDADEIIIVKNGLITDSSFSNLIFFDGQKWLTPAHPLLKGTMRSFLIDSQEIEETDIRVDDLKKFNSFKLINSMLSPDETEPIDISAIRKFE